MTTAAGKIKRGFNPGRGDARFIPLTLSLT
jgi:hypothetical protein